MAIFCWGLLNVRCSVLLRDFQLCLRTHEPTLYGRCRSVWEPVELEIRRAIPKRYRFGGVGKIVLELGPGSEQKKHYRVLLGVGLLHYPSFDAQKYLALSPSEQREITLGIINTCMTELSQQFKVPVEWLPPVLAALR